MKNPDDSHTEDRPDFYSPSKRLVAVTGRYIIYAADL